MRGPARAGKAGDGESAVGAPATPASPREHPDGSQAVLGRSKVTNTIPERVRKHRAHIVTWA
eukprot:2760146-Pyramimonas_sp.AAC.1